MKIQKHLRATKRMGAFLAICITLCNLASSCLAQEAPQTSPSLTKLKSENQALTLSLLGALIPWGMFLLGLRENNDSPDTNAGEILALGGFFAIPFGPSLGYFYAGSGGRAWAGIGIRALGLAGLIAGVAWAWDNGDGGGAVLALSGLGLVLASSIYDIAKVKGAVRRHNLKAQKMGWAIVPVVSPKTKTAGLTIQISF